jgi:hypothetical protein
MCPYEDKHSGLKSTIRKEIFNDLEPWEQKEIPDSLLKKMK